MNSLGLSIRIQSILSQFTTNTRRLVSTEGNTKVRVSRGVDPYHTSLKFASDLVCSGDLFCEESSGEAVRGVVGLGDGFLIGGELSDGNDGAEDFFLHDLHVLRGLFVLVRLLCNWGLTLGTYVGEDGGMEEVSLVAVLATSVEKLSTGLAALLDVGEDALVLCLGDLGTLDG